MREQENENELNFLIKTHRELQIGPSTFRQRNIERKGYKVACIAVKKVVEFHGVVRKQSTMAIEIEM